MSGSIEAHVCAALDALDATYELLPCDPELADTQAFCAHYGIPLEDSANAIIVASKKEPRRYSACLVLATTRLNVNHAVRRLMGVKRLSFATPEQTRELTGMMVGGVTPFGLPEDLTLYIDRRVMGRASIVIGGGSRSCKIRVAPSVLEQLPRAQVVDDLAVLDEREGSRARR